MSTKKAKPAVEIFPQVIKGKKLKFKRYKAKVDLEQQQIQAKKDAISAKCAKLQNWFETLLRREPQFKQYLDLLSNAYKKHYRSEHGINLVAPVYSENFVTIKTHDGWDNYYILVELLLINCERYEYRLNLYHTDGYDSRGNVDIFYLTKSCDFAETVKKLTELETAINLAIKISKNALKLMKEAVEHSHHWLDK